VPRPLTDRGKGSYWTVDDNVDPRTGVHRVRRKKTSSKKKGDAADATEENDQDFGEADYAPPPEFDAGAHQSPFDAALDQSEVGRSQTFQLPYNTWVAARA
jgi:forkhead box protein J2/3